MIIYNVLFFYMKKITNILTLVSVLSLNSFYAFATDPTLEPMKEDAQSSGGINWFVVAFFAIVGIIIMKCKPIRDELCAKGRKNLYG